MFRSAGAHCKSMLMVQLGCVVFMMPLRIRGDLIELERSFFYFLMLCCLIGASCWLERPLNSFEVVSKLNPAFVCAVLLILLANIKSFLSDLFWMKTFRTRIPEFSLVLDMLCFCLCFFDFFLLTAFAQSTLHSFIAEAWGVTMETFLVVGKIAGNVADWFILEFRLLTYCENKSLPI